MTDKACKERYMETEEHMRVFRGLPEAVKEDLIKNASILEVGYRIGLMEGRKQQNDGTSGDGDTYTNEVSA